MFHKYQSSPGGYSEITREGIKTINTGKTCPRSIGTKICHYHMRNPGFSDHHYVIHGLPTVVWAS